MGRWLAWVHAGKLPALPRLLFPPVVLSALAIVLLVAGTAHAAPAPEAPASPAGLTDMQAGRLLLRAGRLEHARAFLEQARPAGEEERIERLFLLGRIEMRLGMPKRAAERFEAILALRPGLVRVRLELARALYAAGRDGEARHHFTTTLAAELPASVGAAVEGYLRRLNVRKRWSLSFSVSRLPEIQRPERETVLIGGVPFRLDEDARSSSGAGWLVSAGGSFSPRLSDDLRGVLGASVATKRYRRSEWDDLSASGDIGLARLFGEGSVSGGLRFGRRWAGGERLHRSIGPWARLRRRLNDSTHVDVALGAVLPHARVPAGSGRLARHRESAVRARAGRPHLNRGGTDVRGHQRRGGPPLESPDRPRGDGVPGVQRWLLHVAQLQRTCPAA